MRSVGEVEGDGLDRDVGPEVSPRLTGPTIAHVDSLAEPTVNGNRCHCEPDDGLWGRSCS